MSKCAILTEDNAPCAELTCHACEGAGCYTGTVMVCCGFPNFDGSCCGMGKPDAILTQCELCEGTGKVDS